MAKRLIIRGMMKDLALAGAIALVVYQFLPGSSEPAYEEFKDAAVCSVNSYNGTFEDYFKKSYFVKTPENEEFFLKEIKRLNGGKDLKDLEGKVSVKIPCLVG